MTPPSASDAATDRRTVGDILLARGYVTQTQLEDAAASQQETGKPLGQVLVEAGAITRLELASALAEQWSDTATWLGPPEGAKGRGTKPARPYDGDALSTEAREAGYTQQLQEAVVELARRVAIFEPAIAELRLRIESGEVEGAQRLLDRVEVVQDGVTVLSRRIDELTEGTERTLAVIEQHSTDLTVELDALKAHVERAGTGTAIEELRARIEELTVRPVGDPELATTVALLTGRIDVLAERTADRAEAATVDALRSVVEDLAASLEQRAENSSLEEVRSTVAELAARPQADPGLAAQLEELTGRIEALAGTDALEAVRSAVEEMAGRPAGDPEVTARIDELAARVDGLATSLEAHPENNALAALQDALDELSGRIASLAEAQALENLRASLEEVSARPAIAPELLDQLSELAARIEALAEESGTVDGAAFDAMRDEITSLTALSATDPELEQRIDHVVSRLDAVHARVEEIASTVESDVARPSADPELAGRLESIAARVEELATALAQTGDSATRDEVAEVRGDLTVMAAAVARIDELGDRLQRVEDVAATPHADGSAGSTDLQAALEARIADVVGRAEGIAQETVGALERWASEREALEARIDALAAGLADAKLQTAQTDVAPQTTAEPAPRAKAKAKTTKAVDETPVGVESELERLQMSVERINLHLGERERAISELMRSRAGDVKVEELVARIAELEQATGAGPPTPGKGGAETPLGGNADMHAELRGLAQRLEETEKLAKADRDKVLTQLERMASSIDWRFRRLETGEENAA